MQLSICAAHAPHHTPKCRMQIAEKKLREALALVRANRAARVIQASWKSFKKAREAARKKAKKAEAAKKKKK